MVAQTRIKFRPMYFKIRAFIQVPTLLFIILIFICVGIFQYYFVRNQSYKNVENELINGANQISNEAVDSNGWKVKKYRRSLINFSNWQIIDTSGIIIDFEGFLPNVVGNIKPLEEKYFQQPQTILSEMGEQWKILARHLDSGYVVLGIDRLTQPKIDDSLLYANAALFGTNLHQALKISPHEIDEVVDIAIISSDNQLRYMWGGIPLKSSSLSTEFLVPHFQKITTPEGMEYIYFKPVTLIGENKPIGVVIVSKNITEIEEMIKIQSYVIIGVILVAAFLILLLVARSLRKNNPPSFTVAQAISIGENEYIEFKESYSWDIREDKENGYLRFEVVEAIAGFSNSIGGQVFIGIADDYSVKG